MIVCVIVIMKVVVVRPVIPEMGAVGIVLGTPSLIASSPPSLSGATARIAVFGRSCSAISRGRGGGTSGPSPETVSTVVFSVSHFILNPICHIVIILFRCKCLVESWPILPPEICTRKSPRICIIFGVIVVVCMIVSSCDISLAGIILIGVGSLHRHGSLFRAPRAIGVCTVQIIFFSMVVGIIRVGIGIGIGSADGLVNHGHIGIIHSHSIISIHGDLLMNTSSSPGQVPAGISNGLPVQILGGSPTN
mmetsp:Transcript_3764/g.8085  ORF Transcript_3764/g.8085 Transcript_3764/m.8085 type:complete len:249 (+) Transcript_3764:1282-2028(+)